MCDDWCDSVCRGEGSSKVKDRHWLLVRMLVILLVSMVLMMVVIILFVR